jgi:hypothetical protein
MGGALPLRAGLVDTEAFNLLFEFREDVRGGIRVSVLNPLSALFPVCERAHIADSPVLVIDDDVAVPHAVHEVTAELHLSGVVIEHALDSASERLERFGVHVYAVSQDEIVQGHDSTDDVRAAAQEQGHEKKSTKHGIGISVNSDPASSDQFIFQAGTGISLGVVYRVVSSLGGPGVDGVAMVDS